MEFIDLGLSVKWAKCNIGASNPEEYGYDFPNNEGISFTNTEIKPYFYVHEGFKLDTDVDELLNEKRQAMVWSGEWVIIG